MRTLLVNPKARTKTRSASKPAVIVVRNAQAPARRRRRRNADLLPNPRRRAKVVVVNPRRRRRRTGNPQQLIIPNAGRRRRRRNPGFSWKGGLMNVAIGGGSALAVYMANRFVIADLFYKSDQHWNSDDNRRGALMRVGLRMVLGGLAAFFFPGAIGASVNGAMWYPGISELDAWWQNRRGTVAEREALVEHVNPFHQQASTPTAADLLDADLQAAFGYR